MLTLGSEVVLRDGSQGTINRIAEEQPEVLYLVSLADGSTRVVAESDLWLLSEYREWIQLAFNWDGTERRQGERRRADARPAENGSERRREERRQRRLPPLD
jgi:hypothetical protein